MNSNQLDKLHEFDFWSMIHNLDWGGGNTKCSAAKRYIMVNQPPYKVNAFRRIAHSHTTELVEKYTSTLGLTFHYSEIYNAAYEVISYGKSEYNKYFEDPTLLTLVIESLIEKDDDEKFVYALPIEDDFYNLDII